MHTNGVITIFHKDNTNGAYSKGVFPDAFIRFVQSHASDQGGVTAQKDAIFRIPCAVGTTAEFGTIRIKTGATEDSADGSGLFDISLGDYVFLGETDQSAPPKAQCFSVSELRANLRGTNPHIMLKGR